VNESFAPHPYVIVAPPHHPLAGRKRIPVSRLAREPFVVREDRLGHLELDGRGLRRAHGRAEHRDEDPQHRGPSSRP
jgi:DNA-binding transcriptional LysR family regulator